MNFIPKAVLFDFDGTLAVLTLDFAEMRKAAAAALAKALPPAKLLGYDPEKPVMEALAGLLPTLPPAEAEQVKDLVEHALIDFEVEAAKRSRLFPFALPALKKLRDKNIPCVIVTRNCRPSVETVFPDHARYCSALLTRHDVRHIKPHPEHLLSALRPLGIAPEQALMVGDHPTDILAGKNAGCKSAGVLTGESKAELMSAAEPDYLAWDVEELMGLLRL